MKKSIQQYIEEGYDIDQINGIKYALEQGGDIEPYLDLQYRGSCIKEIAIGLKEGLDISQYADLKYTWRKMREIRFGLEQHLDISKYNDPLYSYWQMREIRLGLKAKLDVSYYDSFMYTAKEMRKRRIFLLNTKNLPDISGNWTAINEADYSLCISPDNLRVYLKWNCVNPVDNSGQLQDILQKHGIKYGIDNKAIEDFALKYSDESKYPTEAVNVLVAKGKAPKDGNDGYYEWKFQVVRKSIPTLKEDGSIDFEKIGCFNDVTKGQELAVYHFAKEAIDGIDVYGKKIHAKAGREKEVLMGTGFELLPDFCTYVATVDGSVCLKNGKLVVEHMLIKENVDRTDSKIIFKGDVYIKGNIEGPVYIETGGHLIVDGFVKNARINCSGDLILKSGINNVAEEKSIYVKGRVISRFFEYVNLKAKGNVYFGNSLNSNIYTYGEIVSYGTKGGIIGGVSYSEKGYCLSNVGNSAGMTTILELGSNEDIHSIKNDVQTRKKEIKNAIANLANARNQYKFHSAMLLKNSDNMIIRIENTIREKNKELIQINNSVDAITKRETRACNSKIVVEQQIFDNVHIQYFNQKIKAIQARGVEIKIDNNNICMEKMDLFDSQSA